MPKTRRRPDVSYCTGEQMPEPPPSGRDIAIAPAWCIEVVSPTNNAADLDAKVAEYFRAGVELVWVIYPKTQTIHAFQPDGNAHVYRDSETITAKPVLPGFGFEVARLFIKSRPSSRRG